MLLLPGTLMSLYELTLGDGGIMMARLLGASYLLLCVMLVLARNDPGSQSLKAIVLAVFVGDTIGFVVALISQIGGAVGALGWTTVALYLFLALGFGYFQFFKPPASS